MSRGQELPPLPFKQIPVRDALERAGSVPCVVRTGDTLEATVERLSDTPGIRTVAVVDDEYRLVGVIPIRTMLDELYLAVAPEEFLAEIGEEEKLEEFGRISRARTAGELMLSPVHVTMDDTVRDAFAKMHEHDLGGLPIVDEEGKVAGYLDRLNLIRLWLRRRRGESTGL
ncbi:MAG: CBS domain-containing protein [Chloroflexi bacterium]|nr:CBS domain-containing protein [Chloroflexota bacterium]